MLTLKLTTIGNSVGVVLPKEALDRLHVWKGDKVYLAESPDGFRLTPYDPEFEKQMTMASIETNLWRLVLGYYCPTLNDAEHNIIEGRAIIASFGLMVVRNSLRTTIRPAATRRVCRYP